MRALLQAHRLHAYLEGDHLTFLAVRLPEKGMQGILRALLRHPNVDYVEANTRRRYRPEGGDQIDIDAKQIDHFVEAAWGYTQGTGAKIAILDSGLGYDPSILSFHPDAQAYSNHGVAPLGFVDDLGCGPGGDTSGQENGVCTAQDDNADQYGNPDEGGHGTKMVGLVGANDNSFGRQGVAPYAQVYSLKVSFNTYPYGRGDCGGQEWTYCVENDDELAAIQYVTNNDFDVASMSYSGYTGPSIDDALHDAYHNGDVLLLTSLSYGPDLDWYSANSSVMAVGAVNRDYTIRYTYEGNFEYREISGTAFGGTTRAECPDRYDPYCSVASLESDQYDDFVGGSSAATANVAGIAGLLRSHEAGLTAPQTRNRLERSSFGNHGVADAETALRGDYGLYLAEVSGETVISTAGSYEWSTWASGGEGPTSYSFVWEYTDSGPSGWTVVGTGGSYSRYVGVDDPDIFGLRVTVTSAGRTYWRHVSVRNEIPEDPSCGGPGEPVCPY